MGRTIPSFRNVLAMEKADWKRFRNALDKSERKKFDDMFDIPRLYLSACSNSVQLVPLHPIIISIPFHHYKELLECMEQFEQMEVKVNNGKKKSGLTEEEEKQEEEYLQLLRRVRTIRILKFLTDKTRELIGTIHGFIIPLSDLYSLCT
jgi:hypothetical protein